MTRKTLTKILILVILAFIICLPEFFSLHRVSKVTFLCLPYRHCERGNQGKEGENGKMEDAEKNKSRGMCDPSQNAEVENWEQPCTQEKPSNMTDPGPDSGRGSGGDSENSWFMCRTDLDMAELHSNISSSAVQLKVSVELQLGGAETLNLTLYGHNNHSHLDLHPPEEQEEETDGGKGDKGQGAFYCCLPGVLPAAGSTNRTRCLLWLANQTVSTAAAEARLPWKRTGKAEWRCMFRVLCLALLCVLLLTVVTSVLGELYRRKRSRKKPTVHPVYNFTGQQVDDGDDHTENLPPEVLHFCGSRRWSELSPIKEAQSQEDIETLLDGNVNSCYTANLHHRVHPSISSTTEGQKQERSIETDFK
ncbi:uncharacterized protein LOC128437392 isoform X1 [Pleuronectes platessa]|uniref:uncharacterized protein LOC128437392 isoform X1 n=2 Tax=Pleuronectes platessa TaxID=8262 RepID=UPI00232A67D0|nr:uncharacterized protein LOC128437392 isoform X1 [Pleuronectes platessa]